MLRETSSLRLAPKMNYTVRDCSTTVRLESPLPRDKAVISHYHPATTSQRTVADKMSRFQNYIGLYSYEHLPNLQNYNFFSSLLGIGEKYTHCIVLTQSTEADQLSAWILFESTDEASGKEALICIHKTVHPLLQDGTVLVTEALLDRLITPNPVPSEDLATIVLELMEANPLAHPEWPMLIQAVLGTRKTQGSSVHHDKSKIWEQLMKKISTVNFLKKPIDLHAAAETDESDSVRQIMVKKASISPSGAVTESVDTPQKERDEDIFYDIDTYDEESRTTPLYKSVMHGYALSSLFFLLSGANPNFIHPLSGNSCLHLATEQGSLLMVKLLLTFYADMTIKNTDGKTPLDMLADDSEDCEDIRLLFKEMEKLKKEYELLPRSPVEKSTNDGQCLLSIDGGGSRAVGEVQILMAIEKRMLELNPKCKPFVSHFDYVAGTSAGALQTLLLVYNKVSLKDARALGANCSTFTGGNSVYEKTKNLEHHIKSIFGQTRVMADVTSPRVIVTGTLAKTIPPKLHLITNYGEPRNDKPGPKERKVWEAARISTAAPTYFHSYENFVDGGLMANNPTVDAIAEMTDQVRKSEGCPLKLSCVLSIGAGRTKPVDCTNIDAAGNSFCITGLAAKVDGYKSLIAMLIAQVTQPDGQYLQQSEALCYLSGGAYYRLSAPIGKMIPLDTSNPVELIEPMFDAFIYCLRNPKLIDSVARTLLSNPRLY